MGGFLVEEYREKQNDIEETRKALGFIYEDLYIDSIYYELRLARINENIRDLEIGVNKTNLSVEDFRKLHAGLRRAEDYSVRDYGYKYLINNIKNPKVKFDSVLTLITTFHKNSSEGDYGMFNKLYWEITHENYLKLFEMFPNFFNADTTLANNEIRRNIKSFLADPYWQGRINLTYQECSGIIKPLSESNRYWNNEIMRQLKTEIPDYKLQQLSNY
jgi:hypothetical protein